jgi:hypothetical protein
MRNDWTAPIDAYCERLDASFWAEPVNALSNLSFLLAAFYGLRRWAGDGRADVGVLVLALLAGAIGVGSFLFHTVATRWAALADVVPIGLFIVAGIHLALRRVAGIGVLPAALGLAVYVLVAIATPIVWRTLGPEGPDPLNGSAGYLPALAALAGLGLAGRARRVAGAPALLAAAAVLAVSLVFRTLDQRVCETIPLGSHFLWHLLNGLVLGLCIRGIADSRRSGS